MSEQDDELARLRAENASLRAEVEALKPPPPKPAPAPAPPATNAPLEDSSLSKVGPGLIAAGIGVLSVGAVIYALVATPTPPDLTATAATPASTYEPEAEPAPPPPPPELKYWMQSSSHDEMRGTTDRTACLQSEEPIILQPPYRPTRVNLCFRKSAKFGHDAYLVLQSDGQFLCRSYDGCTVRVKVDGAAPSAYSALTAKDGSPEIIFFQNSKRLETAARTARKIIVEAEFYRAGVQQMAFETESDLKWQTD